MNDENLHDELSLDDLFSNINKNDNKDAKITVPFKFLDAYTIDDKDIFYGRNKEIDEIYRKFYANRSLLIYGKSGTGKSSVVNCGLRAKIPKSDLFPITVRCGNFAHQNFIAELIKYSSQGAINAVEYLRNIYDQKFKPIAIIFDQFEEIFILSSKEERKKLLNEIKQILESDLSVNFIFIIREEYYANLTEFEDELPTIYNNRIRIEKMDKRHIKSAIVEPCKVCDIKIDEKLPEKIIEQLTKQTGQLELTWFQVLMDKLYKIAIERDIENPEIKMTDFENLGRIDKVLTSFVDDQLKQMDNGINGEAVLKTFVSNDGTKKQLKFEEINIGLETFGVKIPANELKNIVKHFTDVRILTEKNENGFYEPRHDSIAARIFERMTAMEKELSEVIKFIENSVETCNSRGKLLDENDLNYLAPFSHKLILTKEQNQLIDKSKRELKRSQNRKYRLVGLGIIFLLLFSSGFTIWALISKNEAVKQEQIAIDKQKEADSLYKVTIISNYEKFITQGNIAFNNDEFDKAIENFEIARGFIDSSQIDSLIEKVDTTRVLFAEAQLIIDQAQALFDAGQYYNAKLKYKEALVKNHRKDFVQAKIDEINVIINTMVEALLLAAQDLIDDGYNDMARKRINKIFTLDPGNTEAKALLIQID